MKKNEKKIRTEQGHKWNPEWSCQELKWSDEESEYRSETEKDNKKDKEEKEIIFIFWGEKKWKWMVKWMETEEKRGS